MELLVISALMFFLIIFFVMRGRNTGYQDFPITYQDAQEGQPPGFLGKHLRRSHGWQNSDSVEYWTPTMMHAEGSPEYMEAVHRFEVGLGAEYDEEGRLVQHPASDRENQFKSPTYN